MATLGTLLYTWTKGKLVGTDTTGNRYFTERSAAKGRRTKRWVLFKGKPEASKIPPEWHAWLHYTSDKPLTDAARQSWQKPHEANKTGSPDAYLPPGHDLAGGVRERATGDYEAWRP
ncbi:NADH:ubiquinone oxidoreductase subunit NDUFA12 [Paramagnetospirillum kuznetsovii]|uniref:NADH:ubiquinone oxidoreductase subunit NDUFA12 n=1 Tax=Paramagnetospirillum kuznetsovii TaxID=2053833 RepID=A0A364NWX8_9PROT|nr:NADH:ubiquinone oxidoreductase subunit NDUFA12 [Paramagnetospirillum kuznetsovii]RAU21480.1 NADH:ubiquinone oxidoreductase subunit NDUFA12 [Paramagnetospirillum kuznetsovii]